MRAWATARTRSPHDCTRADEGARSSSRAQAPPAHDHAHDHGRRRRRRGTQALAWALVLTAGFARGRGGRRLVVRLARAAVRRRPHDHRRRRARRSRSFAAAVSRAAAVAPRLLRLCARRGARRVRQRAAMLALVVFIAVEAVRRLLAPEPVAGGMVMVDRARRARRQHRRGVDAVARDAHRINARGALLHVMGDLLGSRGGDRRGRRDRRHRLDADRSDPVARVVAADPALDVAAAQAIDRRADGGRARAPRLRRRSAARCRAAGRHRRARPARLAHGQPSAWRCRRTCRSPTAATGRALLAQAQRMLATRLRIDHATLQPVVAGRAGARDDRRVIPVIARAARRHGSRPAAALTRALRARHSHFDLRKRQ